MLLICVSMIAWSDGKPDIGEGNAAQFWKLRVPVLSLAETSPVNSPLPKRMKSLVIWSSSRPAAYVGDGVDWCSCACR